MIQTIAFNTGRKYAANGQPISAAFDPETGTIAFVDHARMIHGVIRDRTRLSQAAVMAHMTRTRTRCRTPWKTLP